MARKESGTDDAANEAPPAPEPQKAPGTCACGHPKEAHATIQTDLFVGEVQGTRRFVKVPGLICPTALYRES